MVYKKEKRFFNFFQPLAEEVSSCKSPEVGFRSRAEFGVFIKQNSLNYFMIKDKKKETLDYLEICHPKINGLMNELKNGDEIYKDKQFIKWKKKWQERCKSNNNSPENSIKMMRNSNPLIIPRNHKVEEALSEAEKDNNFSKKCPLNK